MIGQYIPLTFQVTERHHYCIRLNFKRYNRHFDIREANASELSLDSLSVDFMAESVLRTLGTGHFIKKIDALVGYSLGGRIALAMQRISKRKGDDEPESIMSDTAMILLGAHPGNVGNNVSSLPNSNAFRIRNDESLAVEMSLLLTNHVFRRPMQRQSC